MSFARNKLKQAKDLLGKKDHAGARDAASQVLEYEPTNYHAHVFLGLSLLELADHEGSEQAYRKAIDLNSNQILAWQGISKFYERTEEWDKYAETLRQLVDMYHAVNDVVKCAETWQSLSSLHRERGSRLQLIDALSLLLPGSSIYNTLSNLPLPDVTKPTSTTTFDAQNVVHNSLSTLEEIVGLLETHEEETLKKEVEKRRTRLGAPGPEQLKKEIGVDIWSVSQLPSLYEEILNHPKTSDGLRREIDSKLLRYKQRYLHALPDIRESASTKANLLKELDILVNGAVILGIPDQLAWSLFLESKDLDAVTAYDYSIIKQFVKLFPVSPMTSLLKGYFNYVGESILEDEGEGNLPEQLSDDGPFDMVLNSFPLIPDSVLASRILADLYLNEMDYENAIKVAKNGLEILYRKENSTGRKLPRVRIGLKVVLSTSLVHLYPPKHHSQALSLIDEVLSQSPTNISCLMGKAFIFQQANKWGEALGLFCKVESLIPDSSDEGLRAREETAWCLCQMGETEQGIASLQAVLKVLTDMKGRELDSARCLWRLGKVNCDKGGSTEEAYRYFIASLKSSPTYAPSFTSLGVYYSKFASPPDPTRASKCFQKAFELDPREAEAARKLAEGFAEDREWDLVDVVARRAIEGEGGFDASINKGASFSTAARYLPINAWAWKALGIVELNRRNYPAAIMGFQVALRTESDDQLSWLRLGEAYSKAGRHVAAIKALDRAHELQPDDWMCTYLMGDVKQQMGHFGDAIAAFKTILNTHPSEVGVLVSLGQAYLDFGRAELAEGFETRAEYSFVASIDVGMKTIHTSPGFRAVAWKTIADAILTLSERSAFDNEEKVRNTLLEVMDILPIELEQSVGVAFPILRDNAPLTGTKLLEVAIAAYSYRVSLGSNEIKAGSTWYDLGIALQSWIRKQDSRENFEKAKRKATECLTQAIREDPGNDVYWASLGDAHFLVNAKMAQHAYIKALEIDSKNVVTWSNLGLLYLYHGDVELANEILYRAQTLDPDYSVAWIGQAMVATTNGHHFESKAMLGHAVELTANEPGADLEFASRVFSELRNVESERSLTINALLPAFFVLDRYCARRPDDASGLHLYGLVCERLGHVDTAMRLMERAIAILEAVYEETEEVEVERRFVAANSNLARLRLGQRDWEGAAEAWESALGLLAEEGSETGEDGLLRAQVQLGLGLVACMRGDLEGALMMFGAALESAASDFIIRGQVMVLLAQTMWAVGTEEFKETAEAQLLECITMDPENLAAINTLAVMAILTDEERLVDATFSEILTLTFEKKRQLDPGRDVDYLLTQNYLGQGAVYKAIGVIQSALFAEPARADVRNELARLMVQGREYAIAGAVLAGVEASGDLEDNQSSLGLKAIARTLEMKWKINKEVIGLREVQRAIMLNPSNISGWQALAYMYSLLESR
ncbi:TPR-like protein [Collybia nuda]|uniref:TPR-like protein n=1 Tax=Collybia nuda TaxID=64659 RepID=A0A9P5XVS4_9AGAR|nr:TPR-like protein [Collybia nuda]